MSPADTVAASLVPSAEEARFCQALEPERVWSVQCAPLSTEVQISPPDSHAASFVPSEDEVIELQDLATAKTRSAQFAPLSTEV
jgi:hypothetical protein